MRKLGSWTSPEAPRFTEARLRLIVSTLPSTIILNPLWAVAVFLPFLRASHIFGAVASGRLVLGFALHAMMSAFAAAIWYANRNGIDDVGRLRRQLVLLQSTISVTWGVVLWMYSEVGHPLNVVYVTMVYATAVWAVVFTRAAHRDVFLGGLLPLTAIYGLRLLTEPGEAPRILCEMLPLWTIYIWVMGMRGRQAIERALATQFANEDLSAALLASNSAARKGQQEAEDANSAKTTFLANMSHELRTPLNAILGFSDIIAHQSLGAAPARYSEYAADIHTSGTHLLSLINDLLDVAKIEAGKMEIDPRPLDAAERIADLERLMAPRAQARRQSLRCVLEPGLPLLVADERAFKQIVLNLLSNAVKFTPEGGHIEIALRRATEGGLVVEVSDDGPGIAQEKIARVFQPFSQIDNRYGRQSGGTGLGLALVKGLTGLHHGKVWIESVLGHGTKACVYFPLVVESARLPRVANG